AVSDSQRHGGRRPAAHGRISAAHGGGLSARPSARKLARPALALAARAARSRAARGRGARPRGRAGVFAAARSARVRTPPRVARVAERSLGLLHPSLVEPPFKAESASA